MLLVLASLPGLFMLQLLRRHFLLFLSKQLMCQLHLLLIRLPRHFKSLFELVDVLELLLAQRHFTVRCLEYLVHLVLMLLDFA